MSYPSALCPQPHWTVRRLWKATIEPRYEAEQVATRLAATCALDHWERWTPNHGVGAIAQMDADLLKKGMKEAGYSRDTIRKAWRYISQVLRHAHELKLLEQRPKLVGVPAVKPRIRTVPSGTLNALYLACDSATWPRHRQIDPPDWWRTALVFFVLYGLRCRELLGGLPWRGQVVEADWPALGVYLDSRCPLGLVDQLGVRCKHGWFVYRPIKQKRLKPEPLVLPLHAVARAHLDRIAGDREVVLPMSKANNALNEQWERLLTKAGVPKTDWFSRHDLRRTCETRYGDLGQHITGHATRGVVDRYYRDYSAEIARAVRSAKVPKAFGSILSGSPAELPDDPQKLLF